MECAALFEGAAAVTEALYGYPDESSRHSFAAGQLVSGRDVDFAPAFARALSRNSSSALAIVTRLEQQYPEDTCVRFSYSPALRALLAMNQGSPAKAIELLTCPKLMNWHKLELAVTYATWRCTQPTCAVCLPATPQTRDADETAKAKAVYSEFLTLWKDADPDIPLLKQAKTEFARL